MSRFYLLIAGSRHYVDEDTFEREVGEHVGPASLHHEIVIVEGGAQGADRLARQYAEGRGLELEEFRAEWSKYGRAAGPKRNDKMTAWVKEQAVGHDEALALFFWDGESKGTGQCIRSAIARGLPVKIWNIKTNEYM